MECKRSDRRQPGQERLAEPPPVAMAKALRAIIHEDADIKEAQDIFNETKK